MRGLVFPGHDKRRHPFGGGSKSGGDVAIQDEQPIQSLLVLRQGLAKFHWEQTPERPEEHLIPLALRIVLHPDEFLSDRQGQRSLFGRRLGGWKLIDDG
jgi:hypothetical protein